MGQRSQIYIRYKNKKNLVAMHLQWNWGYYMVNRAYQLLDFIDKDMKMGNSHFMAGGKDYFYLMNMRREDIDILQSLIQINLTIGSYVTGYDLVKDEFKFNQDKDTFKMTPKEQDNNNGILVIDIQENGVVKYGFAGGIEEIRSMDLNDEFKMISAKKYFELSEANTMTEYKLKNMNKELYNTVQKQIEFIDKNFKLLTDEEYKEIFASEYEFKNCMKGKEL